MRALLLRRLVGPPLAFVLPSPLLARSARPFHACCPPRRPPQFAGTRAAYDASAPSPSRPSPVPARGLAGGNALPALDEDDLEEQFVRGSGPGGQKINKTASCVLLKHKPSGIVVKCQESRSQVRNRELARRTLQRKLDEVERGEESLAARELSKARARKAKRRRKSVKKHFKSRSDRAMMDE